MDYLVRAIIFPVFNDQITPKRFSFALHIYVEGELYRQVLTLYMPRHGKFPLTKFASWISVLDPP